jgi:hypothetical protein
MKKLYGEQTAVSFVTKSTFEDTFDRKTETGLPCFQKLLRNSGTLQKAYLKFKNV